MFRHAHSVKGMASSMGFDATTRLAHSLEDLLDAARADISRFDKQHTDLALQAVDALLAHVRAVSSGQNPADVTSLVGQLAQATTRLAPTRARPASSPPTPVPSPGQAPAEGTLAAPEPNLTPPTPRPSAPRVETVGAAPPLPPDVTLPPRFAVRLRVTPGSSQPGVRGFLAYKRLSTLGNVFDLRPSLEEVKGGRIPDGVLTLELETDELEAEVRRTLKTVADVELESLRSIAPVARAVAAPEPERPPDARLVGHEPARTVRVRTELLDEFLDAAGELLLATARVREVGKSLPDVQRPQLEEAVDRLYGLVRDLHGKVMQARMTPIAVITDRLPRAARDIARRRGRDLELTVTGADIELDRAIVDELADPLLHLLRNAIDHGIEPPEERRLKGKSPRGRVTVTVRRVRDHVLVEVADDGRGMDPERLKAVAVERGLITAEHARLMSEREALALCTLPGVSTASDITDVSGRGVGMDAVRRVVVDLVGGTLDIDSSRGRGSTFSLSLPLTVAMVNLLLVGVGDDVYGLPIAKVTGVVETPDASLSHSENAPVLHFGKAVLAVHELAALLELPVSARVRTVTPYVVVESDEGQVALAVDRLLGQEEVVLKALARPLDMVPGLAGVTILGNGRPIFILDVARLVAP